MKPTNRFYGYSPPDPHEEALLIQCTHCKVQWFPYEWRNNRGRCPGCQKPYAGQPNND